MVMSVTFLVTGAVSDQRRNDATIHGIGTPPTLIDTKPRAFIDDSTITEAERDFVDTVKVNWTSIRTYFRRVLVSTSSSSLCKSECFDEAPMLVSDVRKWWILSTCDCGIPKTTTTR
jgi:hypothetical protein